MLLPFNRWLFSFFSKICTDDDICSGTYLTSTGEELNQGPTVMPDKIAMESQEQMNKDKENNSHLCKWKNREDDFVVKTGDCLDTEENSKFQGLLSTKGVAKLNPHGTSTSDAAISKGADRRCYDALIISKISSRRFSTLISGTLVPLIFFSIQLFLERLSQKLCKRQSRKVIWDMINTLVPDTVAVDPSFFTFL